MREILANARSSKSHVISLPGTGTNDVLVKLLSEQGHLVFADCSGGRPDTFFGFKKMSPCLYFYRGPRGVLDEIERPVLLATACHWGITSRWPEARIVYDCSGGQVERFEKGHAHLMRSAALIIDADESLAQNDDARIVRRHHGESNTEFAARVCTLVPG